MTGIKEGTTVGYSTTVITSFLVSSASFSNSSAKLKMRSAVLVCLVLVGVSQAAPGLWEEGLFACPEDFCQDADCSAAPTAETCKGTLIPNGSFCGCCNDCVNYIEVGGKCTVLEEIGNGLLAKGVCAPGLVCVNYRCQQPSKTTQPPATTNKSK